MMDVLTHVLAAMAGASIAVIILSILREGRDDRPVENVRRPWPESKEDAAALMPVAAPMAVHVPYKLVPGDIEPEAAAAQADQAWDRDSGKELGSGATKGVATAAQSIQSCQNATKDS